MKKLELVFAPGCFDSFEGTQEELDELIAMIQSKVDDGSILEDSRAVDFDELSDEQLEAIQAVVDKEDRNIQ
jgi:hypothetical protein